MTPEARDTQADREALAELLAEHELRECSHHAPGIHRWWAECMGCDWRSVDLPGRSVRAEAHHAHVADLLTARVARARAEALREAADQCERDADDGHCGSAACAENNRITAHWLRDRADRIDSGADQ